MEDVTQSYYLDHACEDADFVVGSLRKWYAVPDGGFVVSDLPLAEDVLDPGEEYLLVIRLELERGCKTAAGSPCPEMGISAGKGETDRRRPDCWMAAKEIGVSQAKPGAGECARLLSGCTSHVMYICGDSFQGERGGGMPAEGGKLRYAV